METTLTNKRPYTEPAIIGEYPYAPELAEHLVELKEICREIGAVEMRVVRHVPKAWLCFETANGQVKEVRLSESGVIFVARWTTSDGGESGLE